MDLEYRYGASGSLPYLNQTPKPGSAFYVPFARMLSQYHLNSAVHIDAMIQSDYYNADKPNPLFLSLLSINWTPWEDKDVALIAGRFINPIGRYAQRFIGIQNPFVNLPLTHIRNFSISKATGFFNYGSTQDIGISLIYQRMYSQGIMLQGSTGDHGVFQYSIALTLAPPSGHFDYGDHTLPSLLARASYMPLNWITMGASFGKGIFMKKVNSTLDYTNYQQTLFGADILFTGRYIELAIDYFYSGWTTFWENPNTNVLMDTAVKTQYLSIEATSDLPFIPRSYIAARLEHFFPEVPTRERTPVSHWKAIKDDARLELVFGLRLERNMVLKTSYALNLPDPTRLSDQVFAVQLAIAF